MVDDTDAGTGETGQTDGTVGADTKSDGEGAWREQNARLRQELVEQKDLNRKAVPFVQVAIELQKQDQDTFVKLSKGEALTKKETQQVTAAAASAGVTREELEGLLDKKLGAMTSKQAADRQAEQNMRAIDQRASKELDGYDGLKGSPTWNGVLSSVMGAIENGTYAVPEGVDDPWYWAVEQAHGIVKAMNPELRKGSKTVAKAADERAAEILAGGRKPSASNNVDSSDLSGLPDEERKQIEFIRGLSDGVVGDKFSG